MKKRLSGLIAALMILAVVANGMSACSRSDPQPSQQEHVSATASNSGLPTLDHFNVEIGGDTWEFMDSTTNKVILEAYDPYDFEYFDTKAKNRSLHLADISIIFFNYSSGKQSLEDTAVSCMKISNSDLNGNSFVLPGNVELGVSTLEEVISAYGEDYDLDESNVNHDSAYLVYYFDEYRNAGNKISLTFTNGILSYVIFNNVDYAKFEDTAELATADSRFNNVPSGISNNIFDYQFKMNGKYYLLIFPLRGIFFVRRILTACK